LLRFKTLEGEIMDPKKDARRRLAKLTDFGARLQLIMEAELGHHLAELLPELIKRGCCSFVLHPEPDLFSQGANPPSHNGLFLHLLVSYESDEHRVLCAGFQGFELSIIEDAVGHVAERVMAIIRQKFGTETFGEREISRADVIAAREYLPEAEFWAKVELAGFYWALCQDEEPEEVIRLLSVSPSDDDGWTRDLMSDVNSHLFRVLAQSHETARKNNERIIEMFDAVLAREESLSSLSKIAALATSSDRVKLKGVLLGHLQLILGLHFSDDEHSVPSEYISWILNEGIGPHVEGRVPRGFIADDATLKIVRDVLASEMSYRNVSAVFQFAERFMCLGHSVTRSPSDEEKAHAAHVLVVELSVRAFALAMDRKSYGIAAALGQTFTNAIPYADRWEAVELACRHRKTISLRVNRILR
jgi:hypothetical protein